MASAPPPEFTFYMVTHGGGSDPFWATVIKGHDNAAARMNVKSTYSAPTTYSVAALVDLMNSAIAAKPDGIACTITDPTAMLDPVTRARAAGIPVVAINVNDPAGKVPYMAYVGQSEYDAGRALGTSVVQFLPQKVHAMVGNHEVGHIGLEQRTKGITDVLKEQLNGTTDELDIGMDPTKAATIMQAYLTKNPDVKAMFTLGSLPAPAAITMLKEQGLAGKIVYSTFDLSTEILAAIQDGTIKTANDQQPFDQGFQGVVELYLYNKFHMLPVNIPTGPSIVTIDNISVVQARVAAGFG
jgi:simple sugar transport system substrate-binding protein